MTRWLTLPAKQNHNYSRLLAIVFLLYIFCGSNFAFADAPSPFGHKIGVAHYNDIERNMRARGIIVTSSRKHNHNVLHCKNTGNIMGNIKWIEFFFDDKNILQETSIILHKRARRGHEHHNKGFYSVYQKLNKKYSLVREHLPIIGKLFAEFQKGDTKIVIVAPEHGNNFDVRYISKIRQKAPDTQRYLAALQ